MPRGDGIDSDPLIGFNFMLEITGKLAGYFTECGGIGSEHEIIEHKVVDESGHEIIRKLPGRMKYTDVTLKRGITSDMQIYNWRKDVENGKLDKARTNCSIVMMDREYKDVARWDFVNAWPSKVTGPSLKSDSNEIGIEEVVIVHEGLIRVQ